MVKSGELATILLLGAITLLAIGIPANAFALQTTSDNLHILIGYSDDAYSEGKLLWSSGQSLDANFKKSFSNDALTNQGYTQLTDNSGTDNLWGECVSACKALAKSDASTSDWSRGDLVVNGDISSGTIIATFGPSETYSYDGHAAIFNDYIYNELGDIIGIVVWDQNWYTADGMGVFGKHEISRKIDDGVNNANNYYTVLVKGVSATYMDDMHPKGPDDPSDPKLSTSIESFGRTLDWITIKRNYINLAIECEDGTCGKQDKYGHYWIEILDGPDGNPVESYGWWPKSKVGAIETLAGVQGELNGMTNFGGTANSDPHQGETADEEFHPRLMNDLTDQQVLDKIHDFVRSYKGEWRWTFGLGQNCRTFQTSLMNYVGLAR